VTLLIASWRRVVELEVWVVVLGRVNAEVDVAAIADRTAADMNFIFFILFCESFHELLGCIFQNQKKRWATLIITITSFKNFSLGST